MYNTKVVCTYNTPDVFLETDKVTEDEKAFIRDTIYRQELLDILDIDNDVNNEKYDLKIDAAVFQCLCSPIRCIESYSA